MNETILIVDDEVKITEILKAYLEKGGYMTRTAFTGKDAIEIVEKEHPDFMILDLMLPDISGEEVCRTLRKTSNIPIIMLTAKAEEMDMVHGIAVLLGIIMSKRITAPISDAVLMAKKIADGEYGVQSEIRGKNAETNSLIMAINEMSSKLQKDEIQKRQLTADVAHELRTPLSNLQGNLEAMLDGIWEPTQERLGSCHEEIVRLTTIVNQMQELYSLENQREELDYDWIDFPELCRGLLVDFSGKLLEKRIQLICCTETGDVVWGDAYRIRQCMINLIANVVQYSKEESEVIIRYTKDKQSAVIQISDSGIGIPKEELPYLFERFYRVDKSRNKRTGGMGIGLSITKAIVERHGGLIIVESELEKGTTFTMKFPMPKETGMID